MPYPKKITASKEELIQMYKDGLSFGKIARQFGVRESSIRCITGAIPGKKNWRKGPPLIDRIRSRMKETESGCWEWQGAYGKAGYGHLFYNGKHIDAHRASWIAHVGEIPKGLYVLHKCDNKKCVNPNHLELGTQSENMYQYQARKNLPQLNEARKIGQPVISIRRVQQ